MKSVLIFLLLPCTLWAVQASQVTSLACSVTAGQVVCTYTEPTTGAGSATLQYRMYRSTAGVINSGNIGSATLINTNLNNGGQLNPFAEGNAAPAAYTQTTRQDTSQRMATVPGTGSPLAATFTGLAVYTIVTPATAHFAIVTHDRSGTLTDSDPVDSGAVTELSGTVTPVLQIAASGDATRNPASCCDPASVANTQPLCMKLHGSGGQDCGFGDLWNSFGTTLTGFQDGEQEIFSALKDTNGSTACSNTSYPTLTVCPRDKVWAIDGTDGVEDLWWGFFDGTYAQPWEFNRLGAIFDFVTSQYSGHFDPNKIQCYGNSMGGGGCGTWAMRQTGSRRFSYVQADAPVWWWNHLNWNNGGAGVTCPTTGCSNINTITESDGTTLYNTLTNTATYISTNCSAAFPFVAWTQGRTDTVTSNPWQNTLAVLQALHDCKAGYAFGWNNGDHGGGQFTIVDLGPTYGKGIFSKVTAYLAPTDFSLDDNPCSSGTVAGGNCGNTPATGSCNSGTTTPRCYMNKSWTKLAATSESSSAITLQYANSDASVAATANLTVRNGQTFLPSAGRAFTWTTDDSQSGSGTADANGLVTASTVTIKTTTQNITFTLSNNAGGSGMMGNSKMLGNSVMH